MIWIACLGVLSLWAIFIELIFVIDALNDSRKVLYEVQTDTKIMMRDVSRIEAKAELMADLK